VTIERAIEILQNERKCAEKPCDTDCICCELFSSTTELLEAYDLAISELKYNAKHQPMIGGNCND
jgi:hypothetical protein